MQKDQPQPRAAPQPHSFRSMATSSDRGVHAGRLGEGLHTSPGGELGAGFQAGMSLGWANLLPMVLGVGALCAPLVLDHVCFSSFGSA